jgi:hypothetical protein
MHNCSGVVFYGGGICVLRSSFTKPIKRNVSVEVIAFWSGG